MFDATGSFARQFTPVDGGYVYYPSKRSGGKLVSNEEYESLLAEWRGIVGRGGRWKIIGVVILAISLWTLISQGLSLPGWAETAAITILVAGISGRLLWAGFAPRRLVKQRPEISPPRAASQARRQARAALNWPFVAFALLFSGAIFLGKAVTLERTLSTWIWLVGSGVGFAVYLWIGFQKLMDSRD